VLKAWSLDSTMRYGAFREVLSSLGGSRQRGLWNPTHSYSSLLPGFVLPCACTMMYCLTTDPRQQSQPVMVWNLQNMSQNKLFLYIRWLSQVFVLFHFMILGFKLRARCLLGRYSTTWATLPTQVFCYRNRKLTQKIWPKSFMDLMETQSKARLPRM
jgi:hypothetical protein